MYQPDMTILDQTPSALLYQRHAQTIFAYLRKNKLSREDAEDILLEVFLAAMEQSNFASLNEQEQLAWLRRVAHNKVVDMYRYTAHYPRVPIEQVAEPANEQVESSPEDAFLQEEEYLNLRTQLKSLSQVQQEVLRLRFAENRRCAEIATLVGKSEVAIRIMLSRTLNQLRKLYEQQ